MKAILIVLFFSVTTIAQMNPDGYIGGFSLHISPIIDMGNAEYMIDNKSVADIAYPTNVALAVVIAAPISKGFSFKCFYNYRQTDSEFNSKTSVFYSDKISGSLHTVGLTLSLYFGS